jgi:PKD repeat protein
MSSNIGSLASDSLGGVYITSLAISPGSPLNGASVHFGNDSILPATTTKSAFVVKYDTAGVFKWLRMPEPINTNGDITIYPRAMDVAPNGDVYLCVIAKAGTIAEGSYNLAQDGYYVFKYSATGNLVSSTKLAISGSLYSLMQFTSRMSRDHNSGRFYLSGDYFNNNSNLSMGGNLITNSCLVGAFDAQGNYLWHRTNNKESILGFTGRPQIDASGNITLLGNLLGDESIPDGFNGYTTNTTTQKNTMPFIVQLNSQGVNNWVVGAENSYSVDLFKAIKLVGNKIVVGGLIWTGKFVWQGSTDTMHFNGPTLGLHSFDVATGNFIDTSSAMFHLPMSTAGFYNSFEHIASDHAGNLYIGGAFSHQLTLPGQSPVNNTGGATDLFMAQYGFSCNCAPPVTSFNFNVGSNNTVSYTYNGTTPYDNLEWNFGDGSPITTGQNPSHQYANEGTYNVCATVTNNCGTNTICKSVLVTRSNSLEQITSVGKIILYPNPATQQLNVESEVLRGQIKITNALGQTAIYLPIRSNKTTLDVSSLSNGIYFIQIENETGKSTTIKFVKQ